MPEAKKRTVIVDDSNLEQQPSLQRLRLQEDHHQQPQITRSTEGENVQRIRRLRKSCHQKISEKLQNDFSSVTQSDHGMNSDQSFLFYEYLRCAEQIDRCFGVFPDAAVDDTVSYSVIVMGSDDSCQTIGLVIDDDDDRMKPTDIPPTWMNKLTSVSSGKHIHAITAGGLHSMALIDGVPYSWGNSDEGTLGRIADTEEDASIPRPITGFRKRLQDHSIVSEDGKIVQIVAGDAHTLFLSTSGAVYQCGTYKDMDSGKFSDVDPLQSDASPKGSNLHPVHVHQIEKPVLSLFTQGTFNAALLVDRSVVTWGFGNHGQLARSATMTQPKSDGTFDLGKSYYYRLRGEELHPDLSIVKEQFLKPQPVLYDTSLPVLKRTVIAVATGFYHLLVVARDPNSSMGKIYSSGQNQYGQLGLGDLKSRHALTLVESLSNENVVNAAAGEHHSLVLTHDRRRVYAFGRTDYGQLGIGKDAEAFGGLRESPQPVYFPEEVHIARIDCGDRTSFAITHDGDLYTWGFNETRATGHRVDPGCDVYRPQKLDLSKAKDHGSPKNHSSGGVHQNSKSKVRAHAVSGGGHHTIVLVSTTMAH